MKLSYTGDGLLCEFILMTVGEKDAITQKHKNPRANTSKISNTAKPAQQAQPGLESASHRASSVVANSGNQQTNQRQQQPSKTPTRAPAPRQPHFEIRPPPVPPPGTARSEGMFVVQDDDQMWEPVNPGEEGEEEEADNTRLEWRATNEPVILSIFTSAVYHFLSAIEANIKTESIYAHQQLPPQSDSRAEPGWAA